MAYFDFQGKNIYYEEYGEGKPMLCLNGIMMSCASWKEFIEPWSANNHLIFVDMLDQGKSDHMTEPFTQALQVEVIKALLDYLNINKVSIMGISYGGEVALQFALKYQDYLDRLILFNTTAATAEWLGNIGDAWNKAAKDYDGDAYYLTTIPVIYSPEFYKSKYDWMSNRRKILVPLFSDKTFIDAMVRLTNSAASYNVIDRLGEIKVPTFIIACEEDYLTPMTEQYLIHEKIANSHLVKIPNSGHASMYEQPAIFAALVLGFLNLEKTEYHIV